MKKGCPHGNNNKRRDGGDIINMNNTYVDVCYPLL